MLLNALSAIYHDRDTCTLCMYRSDYLECLICLSIMFKCDWLCYMHCVCIGLTTSRCRSAYKRLKICRCNSVMRELDLVCEWLMVWSWISYLFAVYIMSNFEWLCYFHWSVCIRATTCRCRTAYKGFVCTIVIDCYVHWYICIGVTTCRSREAYKGFAAVVARWGS